MKTIIAGSRNIPMRGVLGPFMGTFDKWPVTEVVSGHSGNVDLAGELWASAIGLPIRLFLADWERGRSAGPRRNRRMAEYADALLAFWDGKSRGTKNMIEEAKKRELKIHVVIVT